jgi:hypothetical protein
VRRRETILSAHPNLPSLVSSFGTLLGGIINKVNSATNILKCRTNLQINNFNFRRDFFAVDCFGGKATPESKSAASH